MMKTSIKLLSLLYLLTLLTACQLADKAISPDQKWVIDPTKNVGEIAKRSTRDDVIRIFGAENAQPFDIPVDEGVTVKGIRVFGGTKNALLIEWKKTGTPKIIAISGAETDWRTKEGITVGTSLAEVENINGGPFNLTGFAWDYPGIAVSWEGGALPSELQLQFEYRQALSRKEEMQVMGDQILSSDHPVMKKAGLTVRTIFIRW